MAANGKTTSLKAKSRTGKPEVRLQALLELSSHYNYLKKKEALQYARQALERAIRWDQKAFIPRAHLQLAMYFCRARVNSLTSLNHCFKALAQKELFTDKRELSDVHKTMGINYYYLGETQKSQESYRQALDLLLSIPVKANVVYKDIADNFYNLAILNRSTETINLRRENLLQAMKYYKLAENPTGLARCKDGMGVYYFYKGEKKRSYESLHRALGMFRKLRDTEGMNLVYNNLGTLKIKEGKYKEGLVFLNRSLQMRKKAGHPVSVAICHINIGNAYIEQKRFDEALKELKSAEKILRRTKSRMELSSALKALTNCYQQLNDFEKALAAQTEFLTLREELHQYELEKAYDDTSAHYDLELTEKNAVIDRLQNFEIANYIHRLEMSNAELRQFAHAASHDLKEPLRTISSFVSLLDKHYRGNMDDTGREYLHYISSAARRMDELVGDMLDLSRVNLSELQLASVNLNTVVQDVIKDLGAILQEKQAKVVLGKLPVLNADRTQMHQLFMNLISNAVKYNESKLPVITIKSKKEGRRYLITVADNGIGIPEEYRTKIFELFQRLHHRETYSGTGIGLTISKRIVERHGGKIWVEANKPQGSVFHVLLPE